MKERSFLFWGIVVLLFQIFVSYPVAVWTRNKLNFEASLTDSFIIFGIALLAILITAVFVAICVPKSLHRKFLPVVLALGLLTYVQQNFMNWEYGILDGDTINFSENNSRGIIDGAVWVIGLAGAYFLAKVLRKHASNILLAVGLISLGTTSARIMSYGNMSNEYTIIEEEKFKFSTDKNIIMMVFDGFQMDLLLDMVQNNPEFEEALDGFTLYENNAAVFAKTYPSVPLLLTGKRYQKKEPLLDFIDDAYENSLMSDMVKQGWDVGIYPYSGAKLTVPPSPEHMTNVVGGTIWSDNADTYFQTLDLSLFRMSPHWVKPLVYNEGNFLLQDTVGKNVSSFGERKRDGSAVNNSSRQFHKGLAFREDLETQGALTINQPAFRYYHFMMPHSPFTLDRELNYGNIGSGFESYRDYTFASMKLLADYLAQLKAIGAYDNATIIITSDHGNGAKNAKQYDPETNEYYTLKQFGEHRAAAKSILLIKRENSKASLIRSQAPTSGIDVAPTIAKIAGLPHSNMEGRPVSELDENAERDRNFNFYRFTTWDSKYLEGFKTYKISGDIRKNSSWESTGLLRADVKISNKNTYELGRTLGFGTDIKVDTDYLNAFLVGEDYQYVANYAESNTGQIELSLKLDRKLKKDQPYLLEYTLSSGEELSGNLIVENETIDTFNKPVSSGINRAEVSREIILPDSLISKNRSMKVVFDTRALAGPETIRLAKLRLSEFQPQLLGVGEVVDFLLDGRALLPEGFRNPSRLGRWSSERTASIRFGGDGTLCKGNVLKVKIGAFIDGVDQDSFKVRLNGARLERLELIKSRRGGTYKFICNASQLQSVNTLELITDSVAKSSNPSVGGNFGALYQEVVFVAP